jgi:hypothetical protein
MRRFWRYVDVIVPGLAATNAVLYLLGVYR